MLSPPSAPPEPPSPISDTTAAAITAVAGVLLLASALSLFAWRLLAAICFKVKKAKIHDGMEEEEAEKEEEESHRLPLTPAPAPSMHTTPIKPVSSKALVTSEPPPNRLPLPVALPPPSGLPPPPIQPRLTQPITQRITQPIRSNGFIGVFSVPVVARAAFWLDEDMNIRVTLQVSSLRKERITTLRPLSRAAEVHSYDALTPRTAARVSQRDAILRLEASMMREESDEDDDGEEKVD